MASTTTTGCPAATRSPGRTRIATTSPGIGAATVSAPPAAPARVSEVSTFSSGCLTFTGSDTPCSDTSSASPAGDTRTSYERPFTSSEYTSPSGSGWKSASSHLFSSSSHTRCPYKGVASYWSVHAGGGVHKDLAWSYEAPIPECPKIENLICFYNEHVDLEVDGERVPRPLTPWS